MQAWGSTGQRGSVLLGENLVRDTGGWGVASGPRQSVALQRRRGGLGLISMLMVVTAHCGPGVVPVDPPSNPLLPEEEDSALQGQASGLLGVVLGCEVTPSRWAKNRHLPELIGAQTIGQYGYPSLPGRGS